MNHNDRKRVKEIQRLMFGVHAMGLVIDACGLGLVNKKPSESFSNILGASLSTIYSSPFTEGSGLGALDKRYSKFPIKKYQGAHDDLLKARNMVFSHRDLTADVNYLHKIGIDVLMDGSIDVHTPLAGYVADNYPVIMALCDFQKSRLTEDAHSLIFELQERHKKPIGRYVLGETFP